MSNPIMRFFKIDAKNPHEVISMETEGTQTDFQQQQESIQEGPQLVLKVTTKMENSTKYENNREKGDLLVQAGNIRFESVHNRKKLQSHLTLYNPTKNPIAFEIKTTKPNHYTAYPSSGLIQTGQAHTISLHIHALQDDLNECHDVFQLLSAPDRNMELPGTIAKNSNCIMKRIILQPLRELKNLLNFGLDIQPDIVQFGIAADNMQPVYSYPGKLYNPTNYRIAFAIRNTRPGVYGAIPSNGFIEPGQSKEINFHMLALLEAPQKYLEKEDKFMIQSVRVTEDQTEINPEIFKGKEGYTDGINIHLNVQEQADMQGLVPLQSAIRFDFVPGQVLRTCNVLYNPTNQPITFNVKSTDSNRLTVIPSSGTVDPKSYCKLVCYMKAQPDTPKDISMCTEKFFVRSWPIDKENTQPTPNETVTPNPAHIPTPSPSHSSTPSSAPSSSRTYSPPSTPTPNQTPTPSFTHIPIPSRCPCPPTRFAETNIDQICVVLELVDKSKTQQGESLLGKFENIIAKQNNQQSLQKSTKNIEYKKPAQNALKIKQNNCKKQVSWEELSTNACIQNEASQSGEEVKNEVCWWDERKFLQQEKSQKFLVGCEKSQVIEENEKISVKDKSFKMQIDKKSQKQESVVDNQIENLSFKIENKNPNLEFQDQSCNRYIHQVTKREKSCKNSLKQNKNLTKSFQYYQLEESFESERNFQDTQNQQYQLKKQSINSFQYRQLNESNENHPDFFDENSQCIKANEYKNSKLEKQSGFLSFRKLKNLMNLKFEKI